MYKGAYFVLIPSVAVIKVVPSNRHNLVKNGRRKKIKKGKIISGIPRVQCTNRFLSGDERGEGAVFAPPLLVFRPCLYGVFLYKKNSSLPISSYTYFSSQVSLEQKKVR